MKDEPEKSIQGAHRGAVVDQGSIFDDPDKFWGGKGISEDNKNYCDDLIDWINAASTPENFTFLDNGEQVSLNRMLAERAES